MILKQLILFPGLFKKLIMCRGSGDGRLGIDDSSTETVVNQEKQRFTLPSFRYTNIVLGIIFIDGLVSVILWLTGKSYISNIITVYIVYRKQVTGMSKVILNNFF